MTQYQILHDTFIIDKLATSQDSPHSLNLRNLIINGHQDGQMDVNVTKLDKS